MSGRGTGACGSDEASKKREFKTDRCSGDAWIELSAREKIVAAVSRGRRQGTETWQCGPKVEPQQTEEISPPDPELDSHEIFGFEGGTVWADVSGRALGRRRRHQGRP